MMQLAEKGGRNVLDSMKINLYHFERLIIFASFRMQNAFHYAKKRHFIELI